MPGELVDAVLRYTDRQPGRSPFMTAIDGFAILRSDHERAPSRLIHRPALCAVLQGSKWTTFGERRFYYRAGQALVVSVEMPASGRIAEASPEAPYLGLVAELDLAIMRDVMEQLARPPAEGGPMPAGAMVVDLDGPVADCLLRAMRLLDRPEAIPLLYPAIMREICYWLLTGPHGTEIARMTLAGCHARRIVDAIHALRIRFAEPVRIDELAAVAQLSPSAFHRRFKALTSITPLQYQKQLRLLEARRLMVSDGVRAETAAFAVGYESASQFSREYLRMFGTPPAKDVAALRRPAA